MWFTSMQILEQNREGDRPVRRSPRRSAVCTPAIPTAVGGLLTTFALVACGSDVVAPPPSEKSDSTPTILTIRVDPPRATLESLGAGTTMSAQALDGAGTVVASAPLRWTSSLPAVASVDASGRVTAHANGMTEIVVSSGEALGRALVTVSQVATHLRFADSPATSLAGELMMEPVVVEVLDAGGTAVGDWEEVVRIELEDGGVGADLVGDTEVIARAGSASFSVGVDRSGDAFVLRAWSESLDAVRSEAFDVWDEAVRVDSLVLSKDTLAIGGAAALYHIWLTNVGPTVPTAWVQAYIEQFGALHAAGGRVARCGDAPMRQLPTGACTFSFTLNSSIDGGLVPGPAEAVFVVKGDGPDPFEHELRFPLTLIEFVPPPTPAVSFGAVTIEDDVLVIDGAAVVYSAEIVNDESADVPRVAVQGTVEQGAAVRAAGGASAFCGLEAGVVPAGGCIHHFSAVANNSLGGTGALRPGPAVVRLELFTYAEDAYVFLDEVRLPVTLTY